jgi:hypothetical protein
VHRTGGWPAFLVKKVACWAMLIDRIAP